MDAGLIQIKTSKDINYTIKIDKVDESDTINELAEVIDIYYVKGDYTGQSRNAVTNPNYRKGSLAEFLRAENPITINDSIDGSNDTQYITLSLKMRETAGNSYQNKTVCEDGIKVAITATQTN